MSEKKGLFGGLFGKKSSGGCCNMEITEDPEKKGGCCNMEIVEEPGECECGGCCSSGTGVETAGESEDAGAMIKILGSGCKNCQALEKNVREALSIMNKDLLVEHVTDYEKIAAYGIMSTPGLVVKGKVVSFGKVLKAEEVVKLLENVL